MIKWEEKDFVVFEIDGLDARMSALIDQIRPKLEALGQEYASYFSSELGEEFYSHVAKHARRSVNPPNDTWVAFAPYKRGYKGLPHFQIGLWGSHVFIILAVIYEAANKEQIAEKLLKKKSLVNKLPQDYVISGDHMKPTAMSLKEAKTGETVTLLERLRDVKKGELVIGKHIPREEAVKLSAAEFGKMVEETFENLLSIYKVIR